MISVSCYSKSHDSTYAKAAVRIGVILSAAACLQSIDDFFPDNPHTSAAPAQIGTKTEAVEFSAFIYKGQNES